MRTSFSNKLVDLAKSDPRVLLMTGDHGYSLFDDFRRQCPDQFINVGIAEQNMVGMAAGFAKMGFRPFVYGLAAFIPIRTLEQIKIDIAHDKHPVVFLGDGAGFVYSHLGTSHQSTEDIACLRAVPNMTIISPADSLEMSVGLQFAYELNAAVYVRVGKADLGQIHSDYSQVQSSLDLVKINSGDSERPGIIASGSMVGTARQIGEILELNVWSCPKIKPLDEESIKTAANESKGLVTLEEHSVIGGLGAAVAEIVSEQNLGRVVRIGVKDRFTDKCGSYSYLLEEHGLDQNSITLEIKKKFRI